MTEHHCHHHQPDINTHNEKIMMIALIIIFSFMLLEVLFGILSGSLALLADAGHMLTDSAALWLALMAFRIGRYGADKWRSFGYQRMQVLAAFSNGLSILFIALWIIIEAVGRFFNPVEINPLLMLPVAFAGLVVNIVVFKLLHLAQKDNINIQAAILHVLGDMLGSVAAIIAAITIYYTQWYPIDSLLSILVAVIIVKSAAPIIKKSAHILLEGTPHTVDVEKVKKVLAEQPHVRDVHHLHIWSLSQEETLMTLHITVDGGQSDDLLRIYKAVISQQFNINHVTIQLEYGACTDQSHHPCHG